MGDRTKKLIATRKHRGGNSLKGGVTRGTPPTAGILLDLYLLIERRPHEAGGSIRSPCVKLPWGRKQVLKTYVQGRWGKGRVAVIRRACISKRAARGCGGQVTLWKIVGLIRSKKSNKEKRSET